VTRGSTCCLIEKLSGSGSSLLSPSSHASSGSHDDLQENEINQHSSFYLFL
jgi:hypothetical protein